MGKINKLLLMLIAMVAIMIAAVGIDKGTEYIKARKWEKERVQRYEEAYAEVADIQVTISELAQDEQAIEAFIEENKEYFEETEFGLDTSGEEDASEHMMQTEVSANELSENSISENGLQYQVSENSIFGNSVSGNAMTEISQNTVSHNDLMMSISGNTVSENSTENGVSENAISENGVSENDIFENDVSENAVSKYLAQTTVSDNTVSENTISDNTILENAISDGTIGNLQETEISVSGNQMSGDEMSLQDRRELNTSYIETQNVNQRDKQVIAESEIDFSNVTIACLGDSITEATNLDKEENYRQYSYPTRLGEILGAKEVYNLGIGGSSIGRYWDNAFVDRYKEIPEDTDIIIVMGGTNDGFCISREELGTMEERSPRTFAGDLNELMIGLKEDYPDALIVFVTPLPNVLHDMLRKERDYLLPQKELADIIKLLAKEHGLPVIDLYNSNILDSHDAAVIFNYIPDGVHGNAQGYQVLAEHIAAELIGLYSAAE